MIVQASFFVAASVAALAVSSISIRSPTKPESTVDGGKDSSSNQEEESQKTKNHESLGEESGEEEQVEIPESERRERVMENAKNLIEELKQTKVSLESRLFELYGRKEEYSYIAHLKKEMKAKTVEIDGLNRFIETIRAANKRAKDLDVREGFLVEKQLEAAKKTVLELQEKMCSNANRMKGQLEMLGAQVSRIQDQEQLGRCADAAMGKKLEDFSRMELEVFEMKRRNRELELEKRDLVVSLNVVNSRITSLSKTAEIESMDGIAKEVIALRRSNEELSEQVERLQKNRFGMVEELVYQRWLHCCLRFEIQDSPKNRNGNLTMRSLSEKRSSSRSRDSSTSSQASGSESTFSPGSSVSRQGISKSTSLAHKVKKLSNGLIRNRRFSTSILPSSVFTPKDGGNAANSIRSGSSFTDSPETPRLARTRRVSFNDVVRNLEPEFQETLSEEELECKKPDVDRPDQASEVDLYNICSTDLVIEKQDESVQATILSDPNDGLIITAKAAEANAGSDDTDTRTSKGFPHQQRSEYRNLKFIVALSFLVYLFVILLGLRLFDLRGSRTQLM